MRDVSFFYHENFLRFVSTKRQLLKFQYHIFLKICISPQQKLVPAGRVFCTGAFCLSRMTTFASFMTKKIALKAVLVVLLQQNDQLWVLIGAIWGLYRIQSVSRNTLKLLKTYCVFNILGF